MNNMSNMGSFKSQRPIEAYEVAEARKKMGTSANAYGNMTSNLTSTMTSANTMSNVPTLTSSVSTNATEIQKAKQDMGVSS